MLKTITEKYDVEALFNKDLEKLSRIKCFRQVMFQSSKEYKDIYVKIEGLLNLIGETSKEMSEVVGAFMDLMMDLECSCYSQAYKDGMADLMTAMTFNELKITECKRIDLNEGVTERQQDRLDEAVSMLRKIAQKTDGAA